MNKISNRVILSGDRNENAGQKKTVGFITKKTSSQAQDTFLYISFAVVLAKFNVKLPKTS